MPLVDEKGKPIGNKDSKEKKASKELGIDESNVFMIITNMGRVLTHVDPKVTEKFNKDKEVFLEELKSLTMFSPLVLQFVRNTETREMTPLLDPIDVGNVDDYIVMNSRNVFVVYKPGAQARKMYMNTLLDIRLKKSGLKTASTMAEATRGAGGFGSNLQ